ncbi:hypothetical protein VPH35_008286 [Triticum aestivum]
MRLLLHRHVTRVVAVHQGRLSSTITTTHLMCRSTRHRQVDPRKKLALPIRMTSMRRKQWCDVMDPTFISMFMFYNPIGPGQRITHVIIGEDWSWLYASVVADTQAGSTYSMHTRALF